MVGQPNKRNTAPDRGEDALASPTTIRQSDEEYLGDHYEELKGYELKKVMSQAEAENLESLAGLRGIWQRAYRAYHSKHWEGSKYKKEAYKARSKLFRPKTRSAVRKNMATAAAALFSSADVVFVKPEYEDDLKSSASAAVLGELLNYRLDRTSARGGIPWFRIAMGASLDAQVTGVCCSKQSWDYRTYAKKIKTESVALDDEGLPIFENGMPKITETTVDKEYVYADRPMIDLFPPENVFIDLRAEWVNPAQEASYLILRYPMSIGEVKSMMSQQNPNSNVEWLKIDDAMFQVSSHDYDDYGVRTAREAAGSQSRDRYDDDAPAEQFGTIWVHENFMRFDGVDYCWWSIGTRAFLSKVQCTNDVYPQFFGQRPVTYGVAMIEPHVVYPQSPVESWQSLQQESNDLVNLHIDALRQAIEPLTKIKSGSLFDAKQLRMRGAAGANVIVRNMDDIEFDRIPEPSGQVYIEQNHLNADFDDLAGVFSGGSVQTNRSLNETVGGMRLLSGNANAVSEFDLRVWVETWVEPTIRQTLQNIQFYESDERAIAMAGARAQLMTRYGVNEIDDEMLESEVNVTVNVGIGAADPMQRLTKLRMGFETLGMVAPFADRDVKVNIEEVIREIMGAAGYKEGMKFFEIGEPGQQKPDPEMMKLQMEQMAKALELQVKERIADKDNVTKRELTELQGQIDAMLAVIDQQAEERRVADANSSRERTAAISALQRLTSDQEKAKKARPNGSAR